MEQRNFKEEATVSFKKKSKIFFIIAGAIFGAGLIAVISILSGMQSGEEVANTPVGAAIGVGVTCLVAAGVLAFLGYQNLKKSKDASAIETQAVAIENVALEKEKKERIIEEKKQQELIKKQEELAFVSPDFATTKAFNSGVDNSKVWLNQDTKQIQFLLPKKVDKSTKLVKTKIMSIDDLVLCDIEEEQKNVQSSHGHITGGAIGSSDSSFVGLAHGSINNETVTQTVKYYTLLLKFNDVDYPVIRVNFNNDKTTPESIVETIKLIQKR